MISASLLGNSAEASLDKFFNARPDWAHQKHRILGSYLSAWARKLGSRSDEMAFVDLCAGAGRYNDSSIGSPLIAAHVNEELARRRKWLYVCACEANPSTADRLEKELEPFTVCDPPLATVYRQAFQEVLGTVLARTRDKPTLIFLDPYGVSNLRMASIRPILEDRGREPTELLVRIPPAALARMAGWLRQRERRPSARKTAAGCRQLLEQLGIPEEVLQQAAEADEFKAGPSAGRLFSGYLAKFHERFSYVRGYPIRHKYGASPKYFIVHCTDHPDGVLIMNDVASVVDDRQFEETERQRAGGQGLLFEPGRAPSISVGTAADRLLSDLPPGRDFTYKQLRLRLVEAYGPELRKKQHDRIIDLLAEEKRLVVVSGSTRDNRCFARPTTPVRPLPPQGTAPRPDRRAGGHSSSAAARRSA